MISPAEVRHERLLWRGVPRRVSQPRLDHEAAPVWGMRVGAGPRLVCRKCRRDVTQRPPGRYIHKSGYRANVR